MVRRQREVRLQVLLGVLRILSCFASGAAPRPAPETVVQVDDRITAYAVRGDEVYWVVGSGVHRRVIGTEGVSDLAEIEGTSAVSRVVLWGEALLVGSLGPAGGALDLVPRNGGSARRLSNRGGAALVAHGDSVRWLEASGKETSLMMTLLPGGVPQVLGSEIQGKARTLEFDGNAAYYVARRTGSSELVARAADDTLRTLYRSDVALILIASDESRVFVMERQSGRSRILAVDKGGSAVAPLFEAHYPGEFVLAPAVAFDGAAAWVAELDTRGDSDSSTLWRVPLDGKAPELWMSRPGVLGQPSVDGDWLYFVEVDKHAGSSTIARTHLDGGAR